MKFPDETDSPLSRVPSQVLSLLAMTSMPINKAIDTRTPQTDMIVSPRSKVERRFHHVDSLKKKEVLDDIFWSSLELNIVLWY